MRCAPKKYIRAAQRFDDVERQHPYSVLGGQGVA